MTIAKTGSPTGFVHASAGVLVDGAGEPLMLRGVGLGNWLLPEGYMWKFQDPWPQSPREVEALIEDLVGPDLAAKFWQRFRAAFITEDDIARIAAEGMNHVRLPINSRVVIDDAGDLLEPGFALIDRAIDWCRNHSMWVVLDLHGAPGGQTGTHIDDSPRRSPELFTNDRYRALTVRLWRCIAQRYRDETVIAAFDLLNEPLPKEHQHTYADELRDVYRELTSAIREVDPNHMISYEGSHWATNWDIFTEIWDANSILQFHKYWSPPDRPSIQRYIDIARELRLPIYMGEGGENNLAWIQTAFQLFEDCGVSWNFWPWKKIDTTTSPASVNAPVGWSEILDYAAGTGAKPNRERAWEVLDELLEAMPLARCTYRPELISALLRRAPLRIPAVGFGFRGAGESYKTSAQVPDRTFRRDDPVTIRRADGGDIEDLDWNHRGDAGRAAGDELLVSLRAGDWVAYDVVAASASHYRVTVALHAGVRESSELDVAVDGIRVELDGSSGETVQGVTPKLAAGHHVVRLTSLAGETLVRWVEVRPESGG